MWEVLEEIPIGSEIRVIYEVRRILSKNAFFLLSFSNDQRIAKIAYPAFIFRRFRHYNAEQFLKSISEIGFTVITYTIKGRFYTLISNFLVFFYKHVLQKRTGKTKIYFERKSEEELNSKKRGLYIHSLPQKKPTL